MTVYDAFISYSHAKDKPVAAALQSVVQRLGKAWYQRRALRVFRDDTSLSAASLWPSIEQALTDARYLILLASPESAASQWVGKEVAHWIEHKDRGTLLVAVTEGTLVWDQAAGDFVWSPETPLPAVLKGRFADEPKWVDLTAYRGGATPHDANFRALAADFAAAIRGIPKEDLLSQEVQQQRRALMLAWSAVAALLVLVALAAWQWQVASTQRERAESALGAARKTAETLVFDLARDLRNRPGMPAELVDDILSRVQKLQEQLGGTITTVELYRLEAASLFMRSQTLDDKGDTSAAVEAVLRAIEILETLIKRHPDVPQLQRDLGADLNQLADLARKLNRWPEALTLHRRALRIAEALAAANPDNAILQRDVWITGNKVAEVLAITGQHDEAIAGYRKGMEIARGLLAKDPGNAQKLADLAFSYGRVGIALYYTGQYAEALDTHRQALALRQQAAAAQPDNTSRTRDVFVSLNRIAEAQAALQQPADAIETLHKAIAVMEPLASSDPGNAQWQGDLVSIYDQTLKLLTGKTDAAEALDLSRRALASSERRAAITPGNSEWQSDLAMHLVTLGGKLLATGQAGEGIAAYRKSLAIRKQAMESAPDDVPAKRAYVLTLSYVAEALFVQGDKVQSRQAWRDAFAIVENYADADPANVTLQFDRVIGLYRLAYYLDDDPAPRRDRARDIVQALDKDGKLTVDQKAFVAELERLLNERPKD